MSNPQSDRNFDDLVKHFQKNIYQTPKGQIRLDILWRDMTEMIPAITSGSKLRILDAGAGLGFMASKLAGLGHQLVLCDVSVDMLEQAENQLKQNSQANYKLINSSIQTLSEHINEPFDLVLCHAVLEWLVEPHKALMELIDFIKPGGYLSVMFYNKHSLIFRHLLNANFKLLLDREPKKSERLVPLTSLEPQQVQHWLQESKLDIRCKSGVRVIYDYLNSAAKQRINLEDLLVLERRYSKQLPYNELARYQHFIAQK